MSTEFIPSKEAKINDPLVIKLDSSKRIFTLIKDGKEFESPHGCVFARTHFGFILISEKDCAQSENIYPTQCSIYGLEIKDGFLTIWENGKFKPWKFSLKGELREVAQFLETSRRDRDFLEKNFGVFLDEEIKEVNDYARIYLPQR